MATIIELVELAEVKALDAIAKKYKFVIAIEGKVYFRTINKNSVVYIEQFCRHWEAWRETDNKGKNGASYKIITKNENLESVLLKVDKYFNYLNRS